MSLAALMSSPRVGFSATITAGSRESSRATISFCWLPPLSADARMSRTGGRDLEVADQLGGPGFGCAPVDPAAVDPGPFVAQPQHHVLGETEGRDQAFRGPIFRNESDRLSDLKLAPERSDAARDRAEQLPLAVAFHRRNTDDLSGADRERPVPYRDPVSALAGELQRIEANGFPIGASRRAPVRLRRRDSGSLQSLPRPANRPSAPPPDP